MILRVLNREGEILAQAEDREQVSLLYEASYAPGDRIQLIGDESGADCWIQLEDSMAESLVKLRDCELLWEIPFEQQRIIYSPKAFCGEKHLIRARLAEKNEVFTRRNLALNVYDAHGEAGGFPHAVANVETRGESVFAAQNAIDGIYENSCHGAWPYQSWGINRDPEAKWSLQFGREVTLDELRITLRADFPHDSWWTQGTVWFSDGSKAVLSFRKSNRPQVFHISPRTVTELTFGDLIKADDASPFPALTQFEAWGIPEK